LLVESTVTVSDPIGVVSVATPVKFGGSFGMVREEDGRDLSKEIRENSKWA
jgi:hypothetical protein